MLKRYIPILIAAIIVNACGPAELPASTPIASSTSTNVPLTITNTPIPQSNILVAPTSQPPRPTKTPFVLDETYPLPTFSTTFTPLPPLDPDQVPFLTSLHMMDETNGWAIEAGGWDLPNGGHILHTSDGATTWQDVTPPQGSYLEEGFFALDANTAWATPFGHNCRESSSQGSICYQQTQTYVWVTHDGGQTWASSQPICLVVCDNYGFPNSEWILPRSIRFIDADHGWFMITINFLMSQDRYGVYQTEDGGATWKFLISSWSDSDDTSNATGFEPLSPDHILFTTDESIMATIGYGYNHLRYYVSNTGGANWDWVDIALPISPIADSTWEEIGCGTERIESIPPLVIDIWQTCFTLNQSIAKVYYYLYFHSMDGGATWTYWQQTGDVDFIDGMTGWQMSANEDSTFDLEKTSDGGLTWTKINTVEWDGQLNFVNEKVGWALIHQGDLVSVVKTVDGGKTWEFKTQVEVTRTPTSTPQP